MPVARCSDLAIFLQAIDTAIVAAFEIVIAKQQDYQLVESFRNIVESSLEDKSCSLIAHIHGLLAFTCTVMLIHSYSSFNFVATKIETIEVNTRPILSTNGITKHPIMRMAAARLRANSSFLNGKKSLV